MGQKANANKSALQDRQVRLWDLRTNMCQGLLEVPGHHPCAAFDQQVTHLTPLIAPLEPLTLEGC